MEPGKNSFWTIKNSTDVLLKPRAKHMNLRLQYITHFSSLLSNNIKPFLPIQNVFKRVGDFLANNDS